MNLYVMFFQKEDVKMFIILCNQNRIFDDTFEENAIKSSLVEIKLIAQLFWLRN